MTWCGIRQLTDMDLLPGKGLGNALNVNATPKYISRYTVREGITRELAYMMAARIAASFSLKLSIFENCDSHHSSCLGCV